MKEGLAGSIFSIWMCNKFIVVFSMNIFHCWPIDFRWAILSCRCVDNVETKCLQLPHPPSLLRERGPPPPYICVHVRVHAHMNVHGFGFTLKCMHQCVCVMHVCVRSHMCARACVRGRTRPPRFYIYCNRTSLPSFAIGCYGNKGTRVEWLQQLKRGRETEGKNREREIFFLPVDLITTTDLTQRIRKHASDTVTSEMSTPRKDVFGSDFSNFCHTHAYTHIYKGLINGCAVVGCSAGHGSCIWTTVLAASERLGLVSCVFVPPDRLLRPFVFMSQCFLVASKCSTVWRGMTLFILSLLSRTRVYWSCSAALIVEMPCANMSIH